MERSRIRIFDRNGVWIEEFEASTTRSWILNDYGECTFTIGILNPKLKRTAIEFGNIVLVTNADSIPWVGVIDTPRTWTRFGVKVTAYQAEFILSFRREQFVEGNTISIPKTLSGKAGAIFSQIISLANAQEDTLIRQGDIYIDGADRQETLTTDYLTHVRNISQRSFNDFDIAHYFIDGGKLLLRASWYKSKGDTLTQILQEGLNIEVSDEVMTEQGNIFNSVIGLGEGTEIERFAAFAKDEDSISRFGLRQGLTSYTGVTQLSTLQNNVTSYVKQSLSAQSTLKVACTDPNVFRTIKPGDTIRLMLNSAGFRENGNIGTDKYLRVVAMQALDETGKMEILLETFLTG